MNKKIIIANWKTYINSRKQAENIFKSLENNNYKNLELIICPPFPYLLKAKSYKLKAKIGAQNVFYEQSGAYTGEVSPKMLKDIGVEYVIIGHSERRALGETDEIINKKIKAALANNLKIILCVGEPLVIRKHGFKATQKFIENQLQKNLNGISNAKNKLLKILIAYEPVWAIGTGISDTPEDSLEIIKFFLNSKFLIHNSMVLYGGSVNSKNITGFLKYPEIDGVLIGEASTNKEEFQKILKISSKINH